MRVTPNQEHHIVNKPEALLDYLKTMKLSGSAKMDTIMFKVTDSTSNSSFTYLNGVNWLKTTELLAILAVFTDLDVRNINTLQIGYVTGLQSPFIEGKQFIVTAMDCYEVHIKLTYKES